jgi:hypothetical protein
MITAMLVLSIVGWVQTANGLFLALSILSGIYLGFTWVCIFCSLLKNAN